MNELEKWMNGIEKPNLSSFEELKNEIIEHSKRDYIFFPFLIGYVENYLKSSNDFEEVKSCLLYLLYELLKEKKIQILFVDENNLHNAKWSNNQGLLEILSKIKSEWDEMGNREVEMNELAWITSA
jgi:hypothetical protein